MSTPETPPPADPVGDAVRALDRELRRLRISRARRAELLEEVRADLRAAADDDVTPQALLGDVETFAREAVAARGWAARPRRRWARPGIATLAAAAVLLVASHVVGFLGPLLSLWF